MSVPAQALGWWADGERLLGTAVGRLTDEDLAGPSLLAGWSRQTLLAHLTCNADALVNLLTWARTDVETPMYPSPQARDEGIARTAALGPQQLRREYVASCQRLAAAMRELPEPAWTAPVRTAQGRAVPAAEVPWMRCREVWVHAVDLASGVEFADLPPAVLTALLDDVTGMWARREQIPDAGFLAADTGRRWGSGTVTVSGPLAELAGWMTGRGPAGELSADGPLPALPVWL